MALQSKKLIGFPRDQLKIISLSLWRDEPDIGHNNTSYRSSIPLHSLQRLYNRFAVFLFMLSNPTPWNGKGKCLLDFQEISYRLSFHNSAEISLTMDTTTHVNSFPVTFVDLHHFVSISHTTMDLHTQTLHFPNMDSSGI